MENIKFDSSPPTWVQEKNNQLKKQLKDLISLFISKQSLEKRKFF